MQNDLPDMWEHYCESHEDVMGFPKGTACDWCGITEEEVLGIDQFNNKGQKGDDDFETWLVNEAPFVPEEENKYTISIGDTTYDTCLTSCTSTLTGINPTFTIKDHPHWAKSKRRMIPIDILHKWYPEEMKVEDD